MDAGKTILIGIAEAGIRHQMSRAPTLLTAFLMVKEYLRLSERLDLPVLAGGWWYTLGRDEALLKDNIQISADLGSIVHNVQIMMDHADGRLVTDQEVADAHTSAYDLGAMLGCLPAFEVHVNMWSEDFRGVARVAALVESRGIPFQMTLDHSHIIFKTNNERELKVFGLDSAVEAGDLVLDPLLPGSICEKWIRAGWVAHCHARATVPNNPRNIMASHASLDTLPSSLHPRNLTGRGIQYPFLEPRDGEWHAPWTAAALAPFGSAAQLPTPSRLVPRRLLACETTRGFRANPSPIS